MLNKKRGNLLRNDVLKLVAVMILNLKFDVAVQLIEKFQSNNSEAEQDKEIKFIL